MVVGRSGCRVACDDQQFDVAEGEMIGDLRGEVTHLMLGTRAVRAPRQIPR